MIMVDVLKANIDLIAIAERDSALRRKTNREMTGPCPFCGGHDRFSVHADKWLCRNCTGGKWQDAITYVMNRQNCDFKTACKWLGAVESMPMRGRVASSEIKQSVPPSEWQEKARAVIAECSELLWSPEGAKARAWLNSRGLNDQTIRRWQLGYLPGDSMEWRKNHGLSIPCGILIPGLIDRTVWYVKVRRAMGEPKYLQVAGGHPALFGAETLKERRTAIITEGEFDAMLLHQECGDLVGVATMGSATAHPSDLMMRYLLPVPEWLVAFDLDNAGEKGAHWWTDNSERSRRAWIPWCDQSMKDLTDFHKAGGNLREWVKFEIWK